jgi:hypothetical protein
MRHSDTQRIPATRTGQRAFVGGLAVIAAGICGFHGSASAQSIQNGSFSNVLAGQTATYFLSPGTSSVPSWTYAKGTGTDAVGCMVIGDAFPPGGFNNCSNDFSVTSLENPGFSPDGGNFLSVNVDSANNALISQLLSGLKAGTSYTISFYQAAIENEGNSGVGVDWKVSLGNTLLDSSTVMTPGPDGDSGWALQSFSFIATTAEVADPLLTFLADNTMGSGPPIALLDGIKIDVPEPASLSLLGLGVAGLLGLRRRKARLAV